MKKHVFIGIVLCSMFSQTAQSELILGKPVSNETSTIDQPTKPTMCPSFYNLIQSLASLVSCKTSHLQYGAAMIEETITNLIKTAFQLIQSGAAKLVTHKDGKLHIEFVDPDIQEECMAIIAQQTTRVVIAQYPSDKQKQNANKEDEDDQVLVKFAGIVQHFFGILQDPHNPKNVAPNLIGMLSGIVQIGKDVMKRSNLNLDSDHQNIAEYVAQLDDTFKKNMLKVVITQSQ